MRLYDSETKTVKEVKTFVKDGVLLYADKLTNVQLVESGYYRVAYNSKPDARYFTYTEEGVVEGEFYTTSYVPVPKPLDDVKVRMKVELKAEFEKRGMKPIVDTGLGFSVDGGRANLQDFESGLALGVLMVRASDNTMHEVTIEQMQGILTAIQANGLSLYQTKWSKEAEIDALVDIEACKLYEATPYEKEVDEMGADMQPTGNKVMTTLYKNNVVEW